ncbi:MAG: hypothetical protein ACTSRA_22790 [Promethearchaeota archaeon]
MTTSGDDIPVHLNSDPNIGNYICHVESHVSYKKNTIKDLTRFIAIISCIMTIISIALFILFYPSFPFLFVSIFFPCFGAGFIKSENKIRRFGKFKTDGILEGDYVVMLHEKGIKFDHSLYDVFPPFLRWEDIKDLKYVNMKPVVSPVRFVSGVEIDTQKPIASPFIDKNGNTFLLLQKRIYGKNTLLKFTKVALNQFQKAGTIQKVYLGQKERSVRSGELKAIDNFHCKYCGFKTSPDANFCERCGKKIEKTAS